jgi:hypothetical protein
MVMVAAVWDEDSGVVKPRMGFVMVKKEGQSGAGG